MRLKILLLALRGRDAAVIANILGNDRIECVECHSVRMLAARLDDEAGAVVVTEESLEEVHGSGVFEWMEHQPAWSDFPVILLATKRAGRRSQADADVLHKLGNVVVLERPVNGETLSRAVESALRGRRRQWDARRRLKELLAAEQRLTQLNDSLEQSINDRTIELSRANDRLTQEIAERERAQSALVQSQKMEAIGQLTGGIAHDFNNLLTVICGNLDMLHRRTTDPKSKTQASHALQAADRATKLTQQLLIFSRTQKLSLDPVDLNQLIVGMNDLLDRTIGSDATVHILLDPANPWAMADKNQLELAILNLAINARDAMPDGGEINIASSTATGDFPNVTATAFGVVSVSDTGPGVPDHLAEKIFDPFFTTKPVGKGTGLGLSQVYGIARESGGVARLESRAGAGACVEILLPLVPALPATVRSEAKAALPACVRNHDILVVEDDEGVRQFLVDSLQGAGFRVTQAHNGREALAALRRKRPHLVLVDFLMPGMNGIEMVEKAREIYPDLPVLLATGYADMNVVHRVIPASRVLRKPFRSEDLVDAVSDALAQPMAA